jgi:hypothetical protein
VIIPGIIASSRLTVSGAYESIATATPSGVSTITFSSIPSTYVSLQVRISAIFASGGNGISIRPNSSSATNYTRHRLSGNGASVSASGTDTSGGLTGADVFAHLVGGSTTAPAAVIIDLLDYASSTKTKTIRSFAGNDQNGSGELNLMSSLWNQTTAISSLQVYSGANFSAGTVISLYGIKGA